MSSRKREPADRKYTQYSGGGQKPLPPPLPPVRGLPILRGQRTRQEAPRPFSFTPSEPFSFTPSQPFRIEQFSIATLPSPQQQAEEERKREEQRRIQREMARIQREQEERLRRERAEAERQRAIQEYMARQRALGIPDEFYVQLNDETEVIVYRNPRSPDEFWVIKGNPAGGVGKLFEQASGDPSRGYWFRWVQPNQINEKLASLIKANVNYRISDKSFLQPKLPTREPPARPASPPARPDRPLARPASPARPDRPPARPDREPPIRRRELPVGEETGLTISVSKPVATLQKMQRQLEEREEELSDILLQTDRSLADDQELLRLQAKIEQDRLRIISGERRLAQSRLKKQERDALERDVRAFKEKRARELAEKEKEELRELEEKEKAIETRLKRLKQDIREAQPERVLERTERELGDVRLARARAEAIEQGVQQSEELVEIVNRRLFEQARPRTLNEIFAKLPTRLYGPDSSERKSLLQFAQGWAVPRGRDGSRLDPEEDEISVSDQKAFIRAILCGFVIQQGDYVPGFFQSVLKLEQGDCSIKI